MGPPHEGLIQQPIAPWANTLTIELHLAPGNQEDNSKPYLNMFQILPIVLWSCNDSLVSDPGDDLVHFMVELKQLLAVGQFTASLVSPVL